MARLTDRPQTGSPPPGPPPRSPFLPPGPRPRPQLPPAEPGIRQRALAAVILAVLSLVPMLLIGNLQRAATVAGVALAVAVVAVVLAFSAMSAAKRSRTLRPRGAVGGAVLGIAGLVVSGFALLGFLLFSAQISAYGQCMNGAGTPTGKQSCQKQLEQAIDNRISRIGR
jgi:multisubunit Na+/H+ antiporter MnhB subunit